jgi:hypothetical protein
MLPVYAMALHLFDALLRHSSMRARQRGALAESAICCTHGA